MLKFLVLSIIVIVSCNSFVQKESDVTRIEFNSGSRTFREQIILTRDSIIVVKEDFRIDLKPQIKRKSMSAKDWQGLMEIADRIDIKSIGELKSPTDKRTYDAASHGSLIISTKNNKSYTHGFDDEEPHAKLKPLMTEIGKFRKNNGIAICK